MVGIGIGSAMLHPSPPFDKRFTLFFLSVTVVGIGSFLFHATLQKQGTYRP